VARSLVSVFPEHASLGRITVKRRTLSSPGPERQKPSRMVRHTRTRWRSNRAFAYDPRRYRLPGRSWRARKSTIRCFPFAAIRCSRLLRRSENLKLLIQIHYLKILRRVATQTNNHLRSVVLISSSEQPISAGIGAVFSGRHHFQATSLDTAKGNFGRAFRQRLIFSQTQNQSGRPITSLKCSGFMRRIPGLGILTSHQKCMCCPFSRSLVLSAG